jgi:large subunit ribosomal protein L4
MKLSVRRIDDQPAGEIELDDAVFGVTPRADILHRMVRWQLAKHQQGTHKARGISEISGTTKKPYKQKGTGRARQGSLRSPQFRGGAIIFGPQPRSHAHELPKKVRKLALRMALSSKCAAGKLVVLEALAVEAPKTRPLAKALEARGWSNALFIDGATVDGNFARAARNLPQVDVLPELGANVYDILRRDTLILTRSAIQGLEARLK